MDFTTIRLVALGALALTSACGAGFEALTVGGVRPEAVVESDRVATGDATSSPGGSRASPAPDPPTSTSMRRATRQTPVT